MMESTLKADDFADTIWNSDKFASDERPQWVKSILQGGYNLTAHLDHGRWYFEPTVPNDQLPVGYSINLFKAGVKIPAIWNGKKFLDMRSPEGKELRQKTFDAGLTHLKEYGGSGERCPLT